MKKLAALILVLGLIIGSSAVAVAELEKIELQPGTYEIGKDIEQGEWEFRFTNSDFMTRIDYGQMNRDGTFKTDYPYFFSISLIMKWVQNPKIMLYLMNGDYLQITYSPCVIYREIEE